MHIHPPNSQGSGQRFRLGVREKVVFILLVTLMVALGVNSLLALRAEKHDILEETDRRGREAARFMAHYLAYSVVSYDYHTLELMLKDVVDNGDIVHARIENTRGNIMAAAGAAPLPGSAQDYHEAIILNGETLGLLHLSLSTEHIIAALEARKRAAFVRQLLSILAVMLAGFTALSLLIIRPLTTISRVISKSLESDGKSLARIPLDSADEFGNLARGFNALQDSLEEARNKLESRVNLANRELQNANQRLAAQAEDLRRANRDLEQLSVTDPLTGLHNRRYFEKLMESEVGHSIRHDETISILLLDIDHFGEFNELHGHSVGDEILREVAQRISSHLRPTDVACRYGGDEFFVLCRGATISSALSSADALHHSLTDQPMMVRDLELQLGASIGVATIPGVHPVATSEEFFRCADQALRHAKQNDSGVVHFSMLERRTYAGTA